MPDSEPERQRQFISPGERFIVTRLDLLSQTVTALRASPKVIGIYLDAGHSEWYTDPAVLVAPLGVFQ